MKAQHATADMTRLLAARTGAPVGINVPAHSVSYVGVAYLLGVVRPGDLAPLIVRPARRTDGSSA